MLFQVCPLAMRTQGILLIRDVVLLLEELRSPGKGSKHTAECELTFWVVQRRYQVTGGSRAITSLPLWTSTQIR
jgi:hypothetical protein